MLIICYTFVNYKGLIVKMNGLNVNYLPLNVKFRGLNFKFLAHFPF